MGDGEGPTTAQLNWWNWFWIGLSGASPSLAVKHPVDVPALRTFGYQLAALWLLFFVIQGIALTVISRSMTIGLILASLSATILVLAERIFVNGDWYNEGHYWTLHEIDPNNKDLSRIKNQRIFYIIFRLLIGIAISYSVISLAEPGLFVLEHKYYADLETNRISPEETKAYRSCKSQVTSLINDLRVSRQKCESGVALGGGTSQERLNIVNSEIDALLKKRTSYLEKSAAECGGRVYNSTNKAIDPTGRVGCGDVATSWKQQADAIQPELNNYGAEKAKLEADIRNEKTSLNDATEERLRQCPIIATELKNALENQPRDLARCDARRIKDGADPDQQLGGLMRTIRYHMQMKDDSVKELKSRGIDPLGVWVYLFWLKIFVVFLESALFLSKVLGRVRGYAKEVYRMQTSGV
jgi:hypothetical protein